MALSKKIANFLYFWDLKSGILISAWLIIGVYLMSLGINGILPNYERNSDVRHAQYGHVFTFLVTGMIASFLAFFAAQTKNVPLMIMGLLAVFASWCFYVALFALTFLPDSWRKVCISDRCPESLWLWSVQWRIPKKCIDAMKVFPVVEPPGIYSNILDTTMFTNLIKLNFNDTKLFTEFIYDSKLRKEKSKDPNPFVRDVDENYKPSFLLVILGSVMGGIWIAVKTYHVFIAGAVLLEAMSESEEFDVVEGEEEESA